MKIDTFDLYGLLDIRTEEADRVAQILCEDQEWKAALYRTENNELELRTETGFATKQMAAKYGVEWVTSGIY